MADLLAATLDLQTLAALSSLKVVCWRPATSTRDPSKRRSGRCPARPGLWTTRSVVSVGMVLLAPQKPEDDVFERPPRRRSPLSSTARSETQRVLRAVRGASWSESSDPRRGFETGAEPRGSGADPTFALSPKRSRPIGQADRAKQ